MPRDRDGEFEPQLVKKNQTTLTGDIEEKIISMYAKGMTTSDIEAHIRDIYGEGFNRQLRKVTKSKSVFLTDDSLLKMLYLAMIDITKKWTGKRKDWGQIHSQLEIFFADRLPQ